LKRTEFIKELEAEGCFLKPHGKKHDIYANSKPSTTEREN